MLKYTCEETSFEWDQFLHQINFNFDPPSRVSKIIFGKMPNNSKLDEKVEGGDNFRPWKYKMFLILEEINLEKYVEGEVVEPNGDFRNNRSML